MKQYITEDWNNSVTVLVKCGWSTVIDIVSGTTIPDLNATEPDRDKAGKFIKKTLEVDLLRMIDKARKGRVIVEPEAKLDFNYEWVRTEDGKFRKIKDTGWEDVFKDFAELSEAIARVKGVK